MKRNYVRMLMADEDMVVACCATLVRHRAEFECKPAAGLPHSWVVTTPAERGGLLPLTGVKEYFEE